MNRILLFIPLIMFIVMAAFLGGGIGRENKDVLPSPLIDKPFPQFILQQVEAEKQLTQSDLQGKPMLVNVWATWCPTCKAEHQFLNTLAAQGVRIIGINYKDDEDEAKVWLRDLGNPYEFNISDPKGKLGLELGVYGAPETFFVDGDGIIRAKHVGDLNQRVWQKYKGIFEQMKNHVEANVSEASSSIEGSK
ncbi:MAG: DsbE family thiol:disulfide interchange protein [Oleispira sp.]|nr:DsbE family thiol:disulfide interchange protein [Oleispira sp.]MBL4880471.1 DsbE family thiol:disulfide interchange protein [Oleispira sp.]